MWNQQRSATKRLRCLVQEVRNFFAFHTESLENFEALIKVYER